MGFAARLNEPRRCKQKKKKKKKNKSNQVPNTPAYFDGPSIRQLTAFATYHFILDMRAERYTDSAISSGWSVRNCR